MLPLGVGITAAIFLMLTALPGAAWYDTGEFGAVAWRMSLSHPPGHPLHALASLPGLRLPVGDVGLRANLTSALLLAAALGTFAALLRRLAPRLPGWAIAAASLLPAVMPAVWLQGVRAEVYALQLLLSLLIGHLCLGLVTARDPRLLPALAFVFGLAGANHSLLGLALVPVALWAIVAARPPLRAWVLAAPAGLLGLSPYLWLPLRAHRGGEIGWGAPDDAAALWATISGRDWQANLVKTAELDLAENAGQIGAWVIEQVGLLAAALLAAVLVLGVLKADRPTRVRILALVAIVLCVVATRFFYPFDPLNPDMGGYFAPALLALLAAAITACGALPRQSGLVFPLVFVVAAPGFDPGARRGSRSAETLVRGMVDEVPPGGALVISDYSTVFGAWLLRAAEGLRPDVALVFRGQMHRPWYAARLATTAPAWAARIEAFPAGFDTPDVRFEPGVQSQQLGALAARLRAAGLTLAVLPRDADPGPAFETLPAPALADADTRRMLAALHASHVEALLARGDETARPLARWHLLRAEGYAPGDPLLGELAARVGGR